MKQITELLTRSGKQRLISLTGANQPLVTLLFPVKIAHDKGKPTARRGRKAVSLFASLQVTARCERLSGCRRRSKKANTLLCSEFRSGQFRSDRLLSDGNPKGQQQSTRLSKAGVAKSTSHSSHLYTRASALFYRILLVPLQQQELSIHLTGLRIRKPDGLPLRRSARLAPTFHHELTLHAPVCGAHVSPTKWQPRSDAGSQS
jgi:hypothetical protein